MIQNLRAFALFSTTLCIVPFHAQIGFGGQPWGLRPDRPQLPEPIEVVMPEVDAMALIAEDEARLQEGKTGPYRFGFNHATDLSTANSGVWTTLENGDRLWRLAIRCPMAFSINFEFHDYRVPQGGQVFVHNDQDDVLGAFTMESSAGLNEMGVTLLPGDRITIEYLEPAAHAGEGFLRIGQVTHAYRDVTGLAKGFGDSGACNNNVICPLGDGFREQIRSVAMMMVGGSGFCTGQLINNCAQDGTPYFLTANHCLGGNMNTWVFRFNWNSPVCTPTQPGPLNQTVSGASLKANSAGTDVALLQLNSTPPASYNVFYTGWDKSSTPATQVTAIHHPAGDIKKISRSNGTVVADNFNGAACWRVSQWNSGTTEGGSSGSGLWNANGLLIGQLFGGQANCSFNFNDWYGRFNVSYSQLAPFLGNCGDQLQGFPETVGMDEMGASLHVGVSPNPGQGRFTLDIPKELAGSIDLRVTDALGRQVEQQRITAAPGALVLDLEHLTDGLYLVEVRNDDRRAVERLMIQR